MDKIQKNSSFFGGEIFPNNDYYDNNFVQSESGQNYSCGDRGRPLLVGTKADCGSCKLPWGFRQVDKASIYLSVFCICICIYQMFISIEFLSYNAFPFLFVWVLQAKKGRVLSPGSRGLGVVWRTSNVIPYRCPPGYISTPSSFYT